MLTASSAGATQYPAGTSSAIDAAPDWVVSVSNGCVATRLSACVLVTASHCLGTTGTFKPRPQPTWVTNWETNDQPEAGTQHTIARLVAPARDKDWNYESGAAKNPSNLDTYYDVGLIILSTPWPLSDGGYPTIGTPPPPVPAAAPPNGGSLTLFAWGGVRNIFRQYYDYTSDTQGFWMGAVLPFSLYNQTTNFYNVDRYHYSNHGDSGGPLVEVDNPSVLHAVTSGMVNDFPIAARIDAGDGLTLVQNALSVYVEHYEPDPPTSDCSSGSVGNSTDAGAGEEDGGDDGGGDGGATMPTPPTPAARTPERNPGTP